MHVDHNHHTLKLFYIIIIVILTCLTACGNQEFYKDKVTASTDYVKELGRCYEDNQSIYFAMSGSGVEFQYTGSECYVTLVGDDKATKASGQQPRFAIFLDQELIRTELLQQEEETFEVFTGNEERTVTIRIVKLSEALNSCMGIKYIMGDGAKQTKPSPKKERKIEIIGDSISAGYGLDGKMGEPFSTSTENVTKTYGYLLAESLDADYSIIAYSGYGVFSGYTTDGTRQDKKLLPPYYDSLGFSNGYFTLGTQQIKPHTIEWDFSKFQPDLILMNLGTNDQTYTQGNPDLEADFQVSYVNFLSNVREKNPDSQILCIYGMMENTLYSTIEEAVETYQTTSDDQMISLFKVPTHTEEDGYTVNLHPTAETNEKVKELLIKEVKSLMNW
jgi:lysophospholipase L1-like esterase